MKRGTPGHPKTHHLAAILDVPLYSSVGILELMWHFGQQYAQPGDVGRHPDEAIARAVGWTGNAATLVSSLAQAGWIDRCHCHRARIHDWPQHADQTVKRWLAERNQGFLVCYDDASTMLAPSSPAVAVPCRAVAVASQAAPIEPPIRDVLTTLRTKGKEYLAEIVRMTGDDPGEVLKRNSMTPARNGGGKPYYLIRLDDTENERYLTRTVHDLRDELQRIKAKQVDPNSHMTPAQRRAAEGD